MSYRIFYGRTPEERLQDGDQIHSCWLLYELEKMVSLEKFTQQQATNIKRMLNSDINDDYKMAIEIIKNIK